MNLDATFVLDNKHAGIEPQKAWAIGTKWESPILDFPNTHYDQTATGFPGSYAFSSSVKPGSFNRVSDSSFSAFGTSEAPHTYGMWHQYGITPFEGEGVFMQLRDVSIDDTEYKWVDDRIKYYEKEERLLSKQEMDIANLYWKKYQK